ncbi:unnamed protein product [Musa banksii]
MSSGLNLTMSTQNSIWSNTPSPLRSPSLTIPISSSSPSPTSPNAATFRLRLSDVITPLSGSISSLNPLHSSSISPSAPSRSAILGRKSWNPIESLAAAMPFSDTVTAAEAAILIYTPTHTKAEKKRLQGRKLPWTPAK